MRRILAAILLLAFLGPVFGREAKFVRVWPQWHDADAFSRIREYFGGPENDGRETVLRTHATQRAGLYFIVRVEATAPVSHGRFVLQLVRPDSPELRTYTFPVSLPARSHVAELGLTDGDWPGGRDAHPVAWKLALLDETGHTLAAEQSFLWQEPGS